jgi:hypothetical protein
MKILITFLLFFLLLILLPIIILGLVITSPFILIFFIFKLFAPQKIEEKKTDFNIIDFVRKNNSLLIPKENDSIK